MSNPVSASNAWAEIKKQLHAQAAGLAEAGTTDDLHQDNGTVLYFALDPSSKGGLIVGEAAPRYWFNGCPGPLRSGPQLALPLPQSVYHNVDTRILNEAESSWPYRCGRWR